jgi:copper oxidase (laccase) domain-containing protein
MDGHVTDARGVLLGITAADCIPVYLAHPPSGTIGLLHAGWRGIAHGILQVGVNTLCTVGEGVPADIVMHCGVGICGSCYEVGREVVEAVGGRWIDTGSRLDMRGVLAEQGAALGVLRITASAWCTVHGDGRFHSHRGSAGAAGRMLAYIGRPAA